MAAILKPHPRCRSSAVEPDRPLAAYARGAIIHSALVPPKPAFSTGCNPMTSEIGATRPLPPTSSRPATQRCDRTGDQAAATPAGLAGQRRTGAGGSHYPARAAAKLPGIAEDDPGQWPPGHPARHQQPATARRYAPDPYRRIRTAPLGHSAGRAGHGADPLEQSGCADRQPASGSGDQQRVAGGGQEWDKTCTGYWPACSPDSWPASRSSSTARNPCPSAACSAPG